MGAVCFSVWLWSVFSGRLLFPTVPNLYAKLSVLAVAYPFIFMIQGSCNNLNLTENKKLNQYSFTHMQFKNIACLNFGCKVKMSVSCLASLHVLVLLYLYILPNYKNIKTFSVLYTMTLHKNVNSVNTFRFITKHIPTIQTNNVSRWKGGKRGGCSYLNTFLTWGHVRNFLLNLRKTNTQKHLTVNWCT